VRYCVDSLSGYAEARSLELENAFELKVPRAGTEDIASVISRWRTTPTTRRLLARPQATALRGKRFIAEKGFAFVPNLMERARAGAYLHGYWQSARYFEKHDAAIRRAFRFKPGLEPENNAVLARISKGPSIAIHVRRGDYVANPKALAMHGVIEPNYYINAIKRLREATPNARVFAFSDDPSWVRATMRATMSTRCG